MTNQLQNPIDRTLEARRSANPLGGRIARLIAAGSDVLEAVRGAPEKELLDARRAASSLGWQLEIMCDAEIVNRNYAKRGRGNIDVDGVGVYAAMREHAARLKLSVSTIKLNVRIFKTFFQKGSTNNLNLMDKGFYQAALRAPEPLAALSHFRKSVASNSSFSVTEAQTWATDQRVKRVAKSASEIASVVAAPDVALAAHIQWAIVEFKRVKAACPDLKFAERFYDPLVEELEDHLVLMTEGPAEDSCRKAWERGYYREAQIALATGLDRKTVARTMNRLSEAQEFYEVEEKTHGRHDKLWQKAGVPMFKSRAAE